MDSGEGTSGKLKHLVKTFFLKLAAESLRDVHAQKRNIWVVLCP